MLNFNFIITGKNRTKFNCKSIRYIDFGLNVSFRHLDIIKSLNNFLRPEFSAPTTNQPTTIKIKTFIVRANPTPPS